MELQPIERAEASKGDVFNEVLELDQPRFKFLAVFVWEQKLPRENAKLKLDVPVVDLPYKEFTDMFHDIGVALQLNPHPTLHRLRPSGPSYDRAHRLPEIEEVQRRGRRLCPTSLRRYEKG